MDLSIPVTVLCGILIAVGVVGVVVPVLPGSLLIAAALLVWALTIGGTIAWWVFGFGLLCVLLGMSAGIVLTGRRLRRRKIPNRSILVGLVFAVVGLFVVPFVGLIVGFVVGLLLAEYSRQRNLAMAAASSWAALKATGIGILVEGVLACVAASVWVAGVWAYFISR